MYRDPLSCLCQTQGEYLILKLFYCFHVFKKHDYDTLSSQSKHEEASALGCSQTDYLRGVEVFCRSLESVARALEHDGGDSLIDLTHAHHWVLPADVMKEHMEESLAYCGCGLVEGSPSEKWVHMSTNYTDFSPKPVFGDTPAQPRVLDSFTAKLSALQVAVETANLALDVKYIIQDVN